MRTRPSTRASGMVSCMRLMQRMNVDLPHPEGPISAVAWLAATLRLMSYKACPLPYQAFRLSTWIPTPILCRSERAAADHITDGRNRGDDENNQYQSSSPCLPVPLVIGRNRVHKNLQRQSRRRFVIAKIPELVAECGKQQRRRFSSNAGEGQHDSGYHARGGR